MSVPAEIVRRPVGTSDVIPKIPIAICKAILFTETRLEVELKGRSRLYYERLDVIFS